LRAATIETATLIGNGTENPALKIANAQNGISFIDISTTENEGVITEQEKEVFQINS
jgi:hypothetical protein